MLEKKGSTFYEEKTIPIIVTTCFINGQLW